MDQLDIFHITWKINNWQNDSTGWGLSGSISLRFIDCIERNLDECLCNNRISVSVICIGHLTFKWPSTVLLPAIYLQVEESLKPTLFGVEQLTYSGEFKLSPSVVRSLPRARWTIPGSVSAARINVNRPIMPNWSVTIPEGMFVTRPAAAAAARIIQRAEILWDWTVILSQHLLSIHYLQFYTTLCAHIEDRTKQFIVFDRWWQQTD